jgi:hypothetical protein
VSNAYVSKLVKITQLILFERKFNKRRREKKMKETPPQKRFFVILSILDY